MNNRSGYGNRSNGRMENPLSGKRFMGFDQGQGMGGPGPIARPGMGRGVEYGSRLASQGRYEGDLPYEVQNERRDTRYGMNGQRQQTGCPVCGMHHNHAGLERSSGTVPVQQMTQETQRERTVPCCEASHRAAEQRRGNRPGDQENIQDCGCEKTHDHDVLEQIQVLEFAIYEVVLYLDAYPHDCQALELYHRLLDQRNGLVSRYECETGPLTFLGNRSRTQWDWINEPFPWDFDANQ